MYSNFNRTLCLANCGDPDQTANHAASYMDQHCLSISQNKGGLTRHIQALLPLDKYILFSSPGVVLNTFLIDGTFLLLCKGIKVF